MASTPERVLLLRHPGFLDRFIACVFEQADRPLGRTSGWNVIEFGKAKRFDPAHAVEQAERYRAALGDSYKVIICEVVTEKREWWREQR